MELFFATFMGGLIIVLLVKLLASFAPEQKDEEPKPEKVKEVKVKTEIFVVIAFAFITPMVVGTWWVDKLLS